MRYEIKIKEADLSKLRAKIKRLQQVDQRGLSGALKKAAKTAVNNAKRKAPVDTGKLRDNIGYEMKLEKKRVDVFSNAEYSGYVEFGTSKQSPQRFFRPAIRLAIRNLNQDLDRLISKAIR